MDPAIECGAGTGNNNTGSGNPGAAQLNSLAVAGSTTWNDYHNPPAGKWF